MADCDEPGQEACGEAGEGQGDDGRHAHRASAELPAGAVIGMREGTEISSIAAPEIHSILVRSISV